MKRLTVQLIIAILLTMSGIVLLFSGFWIDPALEEFTYSRIAVENALDNTPPAAAKTALNHLVTYLLEPLRKFYKFPVAILSGYRSDAVNRLAGGVVASQHRKGEAADCYVAEGPEQLLAALQNSGLPFDQAILYERRRFLHLSLKQFGRNRMQVLVYMICVICLFPSCGLRRNIRQSEQYGYSDSVVFICSDSLLLQQHSALHDSLSWELKQIIYLPPDTSGRHPCKASPSPVFSIPPTKPTALQPKLLHNNPGPHIRKKDHSHRKNIAQRTIGF